MNSRRVFLKSGSMAMLTLGFAPSFLARTAQAAERRSKLLIAVFQRGAVDGLNMVVPYGEAEYYRVRPTIAIPRPGASKASVVDLDGFFGLHPRMAALEPFWRDRSLSIVHACGSHDATRSHFDAQDYMESATPGVKSTKDGWLNRYLQVQAGGPAPHNRLRQGYGESRRSGAKAEGVPRAGADGRNAVHDAARSPLRAVALTRTMPRAMQGPAPALAVGRVDQFAVRGGMGAGASFEDAYAQAADRVLNGTAHDAFDAMRTLKGLTRGRYQPSGGAVYPTTPFGQALQEIARLAKADVGLQVAFAESGQWDHHINEGSVTGQIANRLGDFADGLAALTRDLGDRMADTLILTMSEFGRAVAENGSRGTDHGHGNAMLLIGGTVKGGTVHGRWPGLDVEHRYDGRDLAVTTDFRDVFGEVLCTHLGMSVEAAQAVFPGHGVKTLGVMG